MEVGVVEDDIAFLKIVNKRSNQETNLFDKSIKKSTIDLICVAAGRALNGHNGQKGHEIRWAGRLNAIQRSNPLLINQIK
jgi:hypothetical protein